MRRQRMLAEVSCIPVVLALLLLIGHYAASAHALDHQCIHDTEKMQTLIYGPIVQESTGLRHAFTEDGIKERTAELQYGATPLMGNIRIVTSIQDLVTPNRYCAAADGKVPDFMGGEVTCTENDIFTDAKKTILMENVLPEALIMMSSALKVNQVQGNLIVPGCEHYTIPPSHSTTGVPDADYVLYVSAAPITGTTVAWAGHCSLDQHRRPVNGRVNFNPKDLVWDEGDPNAKRKLIRTAVHQILHSLGFSSSLWTNFPKGNTPNVQSPIIGETRRGKPVKYLSSEKVLEKAREYFGCLSMKGPELEDEGGIETVQSHWKRRTHMDDMMAGITGERMYLSPITLAAMEDTGHYTVDWSKAETPKWMYKAGCGVINDRCDTSDGGKGKYFCFDSLFAGCAADHRSFGQCSIGQNSDSIPEWGKYTYGSEKFSGAQPFMDYCPIIQGRSDTQCDNPLIRTASTPEIPRYHGRDGRCFKSRVVKKASYGRGVSPGFVMPASCLQTRCVNNAVEFKILNINYGRWFLCPSKGTQVQLNDGYEGYIECPDPNIVCDGIETPAPTPPAPTVMIAKTSDGNIRTETIKKTLQVDSAADPNTEHERVKPKRGPNGATGIGGEDIVSRPPTTVDKGPSAPQTDGRETGPTVREKDKKTDDTDPKTKTAQNAAQKPVTEGGKPGDPKDDKDSDPATTPKVIPKVPGETEVKVPSAKPNSATEKGIKDTDKTPKTVDKHVPPVGESQKTPADIPAAKGPKKEAATPKVDVPSATDSKETERKPVPPVGGVQPSLPKEPTPIKPKPGDTKVMITVPPVPDVNKSTTLSATAISSTIPAVLITSVVFLYLYNW